MNIFDIARLSEWRTLYKATKSSINNDTAPSLMRAILRCDLLTWQLRRPYTHRNGETQPPTVPGKYWFRNERWRDTVDVIPSTSMLMAFDPHTNRYYDVSNPSMSGQWWGPLVAPWELEQ